VRVVQYRLINARCQRINVVGVTNRRIRRALGSNPASAAITARSDHVRPWAFDLPAQDRDLVPRQKDLRGLGRIVAGQQREPGQQMSEV